MRPNIEHATIAKLFLLCLSAAVWGQTLPLDRRPPKYPAEARGAGLDLREPSHADKLAPELQTLSEQFTPARGGGLGPREDGVGGYTARQLADIFGIKGAGEDPTIYVAVEVAPRTRTGDLSRAGARVYFRRGNVVYASAPVSALSTLSRLGAVGHVGLLKPLTVPTRPPAAAPPAFDLPARGGEGPPTATANLFDRQGLTGEGVIVGVIDTGIDWTHPDFIRADGTSRVLLLWDVTDDSWRSSGGRVGAAAPSLGDGAETLPGTVYTGAEIDAALQGRGWVNSTDRIGHGTAVAGTAAGNGRGAAGGAAFEGVAPRADLIIVKVGDCEKTVSALAAVGAYWVAAQAKRLRRPAVINLSLGSHYTAHDGSSEEEKLLDSVADPIKGFGVPVVVAAGNEGRLSLHAGGRFGPRREGQMDVVAQPVEASLTEPSLLLGSFAASDDWGLFFRGTHPLFRGRDGKPVGVYVFKSRGGVRIDTEAPVADEAAFRQFRQTLRTARQGASDAMLLQLPEGQYVLFGFGASAGVTDGRFSLYLPAPSGASFGHGAEKRFMVSSPGNATGVITVGSLDSRAEWENEGGRISRFNLRAGEVSDYSSPGPRRDGVTKPEVVAPGRYALAALSRFSVPENGGCKGSMVAGAEERNTFVTRGGTHLAWSGTSASAPFVAGLIALMLQKNPNLNPEQIKQILVKTASGRTVAGRAVNDERLGYGRVEPAAALRAVPAARTLRPRAPSPRRRR